jgi:hypothetical protein
LIAAALAALTVAAPVGQARSSGQASCLYQTPAQLRAQAKVIFDGLSLEGPTATGVQRFRVRKYLKGAGPRIVRVQTGTIRRADGTGSTTSISLFVKRGERWRIFAHGSASRVLESTQCDGSRKL